MRLVQAALCGVALSLSIRAVAQEAAKKVNPHPRPDPQTSLQPYLDEQPVRARHGMVVSVHHLASDAGLEVLRAGGNAVDAAVATGFALAVVHPAAGNLGGGGFLLLRTHDGKTTFIDFREKAPLQATETMYQDAQGNVIPNCQPSRLPLHRHAGLGGRPGLRRAQVRQAGPASGVIAPAIRLAAQGFQLTAEEAHELADPDLARFPDSKRIFQRDGQLYKQGEIFRQPRTGANPPAHRRRSRRLLPRQDGP